MPDAPKFDRETLDYIDKIAREVRQELDDKHTLRVAPPAPEPVGSQLDMIRCKADFGKNNQLRIEYIAKHGSRAFEALPLT